MTQQEIDDLLADVQTQYNSASADLRIALAYEFRKIFHYDLDQVDKVRRAINSCSAEEKQTIQEGIEEIYGT